MYRIAKPALFLFSLSVCCLSLTGCNGGVQADYDKLGLVEISGTVTLDGQPLSGAVVMFEAPDTTFCYGTTDASGRYTLKLNSEKTGVVPGEKVVRISTTARTGEESINNGDEEDPDEKPADGAEKVPACYHADSKITVQVTESDANFNFDLLSDCSVTGRS
jgi:hypothetical protein